MGAKMVNKNRHGLCFQGLYGLAGGIHIKQIIIQRDVLQVRNSYLKACGARYVSKFRI